MAEIQNYDGSFKDGDASLIYHAMINVVPKKAPHYNSSYRTPFHTADGEVGDKNMFFTQKRKGLTRVPTYSAPGVLDTETWIFTDEYIFDGFRHFLAVSNDRRKIRVYKQIGVTRNEYNDHDVADGHIVNVTEYNGENYFPFLPGMHDKFLVATHVKGKAKHVGSHTISKERNSVMTFSYIEGDNTIAFTPGDWVYITSTSSGCAGQVSNISKLGAKGNIMMFDNWLGMVLTKDSDYDSESDVSLKVFGDYGEILNIVTSDGILNIHYTGETSADTEYSFVPDTFFDTKNNLHAPQKFITSTVVAFRAAVSFLDKKNSVIGMGLNGKNKFFFNPLNNIDVEADYGKLCMFQDYLLLIGYGKIKYVMGKIEEDQWFTEETLLTDKNGMFTEDSFDNYEENVYMVRDSADLYGLGVQPYGSGLKPLFTPLTREINTDLNMLNRKRGDKCNLVIDDTDIYVFMNNGENYSKIKIYNSRYKFWHTWITNGARIYTVKDGIYMGDGIYSYGGYTDNGNPIRSIVTMKFGDITQNVVKNVPYVKMIIGSGTKVTKGKAILKISVDFAGINYDLVTEDLGRLPYLKRLIKGDTDTVFESLPIGLEISGRRGVVYKSEEHTFHKDITNFFSYNPVENKDKFTNSKLSIIEFPVSVPADIIEIELVCDDTSDVELGGFFLAYEFKESYITSIENVLTV